jgi:dUTPase
MKLPVRKLDSEIPLPGYAHAGDAALDLRSAGDRWAEGFFVNSLRVAVKYV